MSTMRQIVAAGISNLTDARYFSAMGVDWMGFDLTRQPRISPEQMYAIMDWVEGPQWFAEVGDSGTLGIPDGINTIVHPPHQHPDDWPGICFITGIAKTLTANASLEKPDGILLNLTDHTIPKLEMVEPWSDKQLWVRANWTSALMEEVLATMPGAAIVLSGSSEWTVGIKDYDLMDDLFERIGRND